MLRTLSVTAACAAFLGLGALPASAAPVSHAKVHTFTLPSVTGIKVWGSYTFSGRKADISLCVKETASDVDYALVVATALNYSVTKHQSIEAEIIGSGKQVCKSLTTNDTAHLYVAASSGTSNGKVHVGKVIRIY
jgi:hypothetical protein